MAGGDHDHLFRRDGRLSELTIDRLLLDELSGPERAAVDAHLGRSPECRAAIEAAREFDRHLRIAPPDNVVPLRPRRWLAPGPAAGAVLALAAALALVVWRGGGPPPGPGAVDPLEGPDTWRVKGGRFEVALYVHDGSGTRRLTSGAAVHAGDRIGFRVDTDQPGELLIAGIDAKGQPYPCYPQGEAVTSAPIEADGQARTLPAAIRLDDTPGAERLVALLCDQPFEYAAVATALRQAHTRGSPELPPLRPGCIQRELVLVKEPR